MTDVIIRVGEEQFSAQLDDENAPRTVGSLCDALPIEGTTQTWGDEIYFGIPVRAEPENSREVVSKGDLTYWPDGNCFCIFYGRTPQSPSEEEIVPASAVNVIGTIENPDELKKHRGGEPITIELAEA
jgi:hypothetical protein